MVSLPRIMPISPAITLNCRYVLVSSRYCLIDKMEDDRYGVAVLSAELVLNYYHCKHSSCGRTVDRCSEVSVGTVPLGLFNIIFLKFFSL